MWVAILTVHVLAMAFFVGGQLFLALAVVPAFREAPDRERVRAIARRFGWGSLAALGLLLASGAALAQHYDKWSSATLQVKLGLVGAVIALVLAHTRWSDAHILDAAILLGSIAIVALGVSLAS
jgi:uncharacterized membrane protein